MKHLDLIQYKWGVLWRGNESYVMHDDEEPLLFRTREEARIFISEQFSYIKSRKDLRAPPHNWRMPKPVRILIQYTCETTE